MDPVEITKLETRTLAGARLVPANAEKNDNAQEVREHLTRYPTLVLHIDQVIWTCDKDGNMLGEQPSWCAYTGQERKQYQGHGWLDATHPGDRVKSTELWRAAVAAGEIYQDEHRLFRPAGYRYFSARAVPIFADDGTIREWAGIHTDITQRKLVEQSLRDGVQQLRELADAMPQIVWGATAEGRVDYYNRRWYELTGSCEETAGQTGWLERMHPDDQPEANKRWAASLVSGSPYDVEYRLRSTDGRYRWYLTKAVPVRDGAGIITRWLGTCTDIHDRKKTEQQLCQAQKMEALGSLAGGIAHDFNNLLSVILGYSELLSLGLDSNDARAKDINEIHAAGLRAAELTRQLLAFSHQDVRQIGVVDLNQVFEGMENMLHRVIGEDVELVWTPAATLHAIRADHGQLEQVIMNLTVNARDAMPEGGRLSVETANILLTQDDVAKHSDIKLGPHVMLRMSDTGIGMAELIRSRVFEPFFSTKEVGSGTGLGLATVFGIVRQSGGAIWVDSEPSRGATFTVVFPAAAGIAVSARPQQSTMNGRPLTGRETILVVEDDKRVREITCAILRKYGYHLLVGQTGGDALIVSEQHSGSVDLLLTDVVMPNMSGPQLAARLAIARPGIKVLYMSGYTGASPLNSIVHAPESAFLQKPFTPAKLAEALRAALDTPHIVEDLPVQ